MMSMERRWRRLFRPPREASEIDAWFLAMANQLLCGCRLVIAGRPHRIIEVEFYYHAPEHPDPYSHRHPLQLEPGRWYFHRSHGAYRAGSFKGLDITCGTPDAFGGILIRGLQTSEGAVIDGPSLCVDHLLGLTGMPNVRCLDTIISVRRAWDPDAPLHLATDAEGERPLIHRTARVGLGIKRFADDASAAHFILRPYRFLTEPQRTRKGRPHLVLALHRQGMPVDEICRITKSPRATVLRYVKLFNEGRRERTLSGFIDSSLAAKDLCRLYGALTGCGTGFLARPDGLGSPSHVLPARPASSGSCESLP